jgi:hypothetical protein
VNLIPSIVTCPNCWHQLIEDDTSVRAIAPLGNANLIATASDLKDALEQLERAVSALLAHELHDGIRPGLCDVYAQVMKARAAIQKANS